MKNRILVAFLAIALVATLAGFSACPAPKEELPPVKIGLLRAFTGMVSDWGEETGQGVRIGLDEIGWEIAGRKVILIEEDAGDTPDVAVSKAKKLVEEDKVDVVIGPMLIHSTKAVEAYLKPLGVVHISTGPLWGLESDHSFYTQYGSGKGNAYPNGLWCYDKLGARTAALMYMDYLFGYQNRDGFTQAFVERGGTIIYDAPIPLGTAEMAPYLVAAAGKKPDVLVVFLLSPSVEAFLRQYHEYGLTVPVFMMGTVPRETTIQELGDKIAGMKGADPYTAEIDTPENKEFVSRVKAKYGCYPGDGHTIGYLPVIMYANAVEALGGDTDAEKVTEKLLSVGTCHTPVGILTYKEGLRAPYIDIYILEAVKKDRWCWDVIDVYRQVTPF